MLPLEGVKVLDLSRVLAGPYATMVLGDLGADVIKVEHPERGDDTRHWGPPFAGGEERGESAYFLSVNRNKRSIGVDLKDQRGLERVRTLAAGADVLIENWRRGALEKLGLGYDYPRVRRLMNLVGPSFASEIFFTARQFSADEAAAMGLVNRVVGHAELESYVTGQAKAIAGNAPLTIKAIKRIVIEALKDERERDLALCDRLVRACFESEDYGEGRLAFKEKRKPRFAGR